MKALVWTEKGKSQWREKPCPQIQHPTDIIVQMQRTTICGTDLHVRNGAVSTAQPGVTLGHEGIGVVCEVGSQIKKYKEGDRVLLTCTTGCGTCKNCSKGFYAHCTSHEGGWVLGNTIDGTQAQYVRIPWGDGSGVHPLPKGLAEADLVMCSDILPTSLECGMLCAMPVMPPGLKFPHTPPNVHRALQYWAEDFLENEGKFDVCVIGCGPVGMSCLLLAQLWKPYLERIIAVDLNDSRLQHAQKLGATHLINNSDGQANKKIMELTGGRGVRSVLECVGNPPAWNLCEDIVMPGGNIGLLGVHGKDATIHLTEMWKRNFSLSAGLVSTNTVPLLIEKVRDGTLNPSLLISHRFEINEMEKAYETFSNAEQHQAFKMLLTNDHAM